MLQDEWRINRAAAYLGGRLVLGSGSTCPQDFRFLACFFSAPGVEAAEGVDGMSMSTERPARTETSVVQSSV